MRVFGLAGWSGAGKTTLMERLLLLLTQRGCSVSTVKNTHHSVDLDQPGKDSFRHREAGAREVMIASASRWALLHEVREGEGEPSLDDILSHMSPVDLVLVEGFKSYPHPKLEVHRPSLGKPMLWPQDPHILALASDVALRDLPLPRFCLDDIPAIADLVLTRARARS